MEHKRLTLFAGHYGSGKTNIAVNYAFRLAGEGKRVCIADLDIVNPYFRTKDSEAELAAAGVTPDLVRFSCGIESAEDLIEDIAQALDKI